MIRIAIAIAVVIFTLALILYSLWWDGRVVEMGHTAEQLTYLQLGALHGFIIETSNERDIDIPRGHIADLENWLESERSRIVERFSERV
jgi:hypothetical protein